MKFLIIGHYHSANRGDAAILDGLIGLLRRKWPHAEFGVLTAYPDIIRDMHGIPAAVDAITSRRYNMLHLIRKRWETHHLSRVLQNEKVDSFPEGAKDPRLAARAYLWADVVIAAGGSYLHDLYRKPLIGYYMEIELAKKLRKPVLLIGHSLGPYRGIFSRWLAKDVLSNVDLLTVREPVSLNVLSSLGIPSSDEFCTLDTAFALRSADKKNGQKLLASEGVDVNLAPILTVSVRHWRFYKKGHKTGHLQYVNAVTTALKQFAARQKVQIVFLSTATTLGGYKVSDIPYAMEIAGRLDLPVKPVVMKGEYRPEELKDMYSVADLHFGTRMHSCILAISAKTPAVAVIYEEKTRGLMRLLKMEDWMIDIETIDGAALLALLNLAWQSRNAISAHIQGLEALIHKLTEQNLTLIINTLLKYEGKTGGHVKT